MIPAGGFDAAEVHPALIASAADAQMRAAKISGVSPRAASVNL